MKKKSPRLQLNIRLTEDMIKELRKLQAQYKDPIEEKLKEKL